MKILVSCSVPEFNELYNEKKLLNIGDDIIYYNVEASSLMDVDSIKSLSKDRIMCTTALDVDIEGCTFREISLEEAREMPSVPNNTLCRLPSGFSDMREVSNLSRRLPGIRFIGGNLLELPDIKIGRYDEGKDKLSAVFKGFYDTFLEIRSADVDRVEDIKEGLSPTVLQDLEGIKIKSGKKRVVNRSIGEKKEKPKKVKAVVQSFGSLFGDEDVDF